MSPIQRPYGVSRSQNDPVNCSVAVDRQAGQQVAEGDPEQQRDQDRPDGERPAPGAAPAVGVDLAAPLEGDAADDQRDQEQQQRQVAGREPGGVPGRERREDRRAADDQPDLVAVPHRPDAVDRDPALDLGPADDLVQHADAEVEALEDEEAGPEERRRRRTRATSRLISTPQYVRAGARGGGARVVGAASDGLGSGSSGALGEAQHQERPDDAEREVEDARTCPG